MRSIILLVAFFFFSLSSGAFGHEGNTDEESEGQFGSVHFATTCGSAAQPAFDRGVVALHNFFFVGARKSFNEALERDPGCGIAYWGLSMTALGNWLVNPPSAKALSDASAELQKAMTVGVGSERERDYMSALQALLTETDRRDHLSRATAYEKAMESVYTRYPEDLEAAVFYALALNLTASPTDKSYSNQLKAADILDKVSAIQPDHPGALHYLIHSLDYPSLARRALPAAERYAKVAPAAPHALHMPSHTYSMLGEWPGSIQSNKAALVAAADSMAKGLYSQPALNGATAHYNDFMIYAELQMGQDAAAKRIVDDVLAYQLVHDLTKDAIYTQTGFAAIPARYVLERKAWPESARLEPLQKTWAYAEAMTRFTRSLGASHTGNGELARAEIRELEKLRQAAAAAQQGYWVGQIEVLRLAASAWLVHAEGWTDSALQLMRQAADMEDSSEKHIAMENRLYPMRELLGDLLLETGQPAAALPEFETSLSNMPNRFNGIYGAAKAAYLAGEKDKAREYFKKLLALAADADTERRELIEARMSIAAK